MSLAVERRKGTVGDCSCLPLPERERYRPIIGAVEYLDVAGDVFVSESPLSVEVERLIGDTGCALDERVLDISERTLPTVLEVGRHDQAAISGCPGPS